MRSLQQFEETDSIEDFKISDQAKTYYDNIATLAHSVAGEPSTLEYDVFKHSFID